MDIWAYCDECGRWFHCPEWFNRTKPHPVCPECHREPQAIENRAPAQDPASVSSTHGDSVSSTHGDQAVLGRRATAGWEPGPPSRGA